MVKLKSLPQLSTEDYQQLGTIISSPSCEVQLVNEKIVTFLVIQLCYNGNGGSLVELCNMMDSLVEPELAGCVREVLFGKLDTIYTVLCSLKKTTGLCTAALD